MASDTRNPMSPSLAGIVSDPSDGSRRIVPTSQRADGSPASVRKERKVRPGHVPAEDVAKYRPGQGSLRAQHAVAQASHQAPPSPSPAPAVAVRRPNPSDFLSDSKLRESSTATTSIPPPPSPTKASASKSGASSSRWAVASSVEAAPAPSVITPTSPRLDSNNKPRTRANGPRKGKAPALQPAHTYADTADSKQSEEENQQTPVQASPEETKENVQPEPAEAQVPSVPSTPESKIPDLPETPGGDWWADEDGDEEVESAAQALQGISIKDAASRQGAASPTPPPSTTSTRPPPAQQQHISNNKHSTSSNHTPRDPQAKTTAKKSSQQQQSNSHNSKTPNGSKAPSSNLLSRLGPPVPIQQIPVETVTSSKKVGAYDKLTIDDIRSKARSLSQELRKMNQLKKYAEAGAVLSNEQRAQIDDSHTLSLQLNDLKATADNLAMEVAQLLEASRS